MVPPLPHSLKAAWMAGTSSEGVVTLDEVGVQGALRALENRGITKSNRVHEVYIVKVRECRSAPSGL
jgi:hypothetical protein